MRACKVRTALGAANRSMSSLNSLVYDLNTYIFLANHTVSPLLYSKYENSRSKNNRTNHRKIERKGRIVERIISRGRGRKQGNSGSSQLFVGIDRMPWRTQALRRVSPVCRTRGKTVWQRMCLVKETLPSADALMAGGLIATRRRVKPE